MPKPYFLLLFLPLLTGCFETELVFEDQFEPVVEAYLYVDKEVNNIKLSSMISFSSDSSGGENITDAFISLESGNLVWNLLHENSNPGNYYLEESPVFTPGDTMLLKVELEDELLTAQTVIPAIPPAVSMSSKSMYIPKVESMMDFRGLEMPDPVELTWDNPEARYYFLNIQNIESNPTPIMPDRPEGAPGGGGGLVFEMVTQPTNNSYHSIEARQLEYFGTHRIIMTSINDEYVKLYNSLNQDSRELNEPYSNINNGLGIFTAFNSDTLYLEVVPVY